MDNVVQPTKIPHTRVEDALAPFYATLFGNVIMGIGFIVLFRHKASLGGINILALWLQDRYGIRAGKLQMGVDTCVVLACHGRASLTKSIDGDLHRVSKR